MQDAVQPFDLARMLLGEQDVLFYAEIVVRTIIIYVYGLILLRWLGSRTIGQLSIVEFLLVIALGSAVGDPMFQPDVPLLHCMLVITIVVLANKGLDILISRFKKAERYVDRQPQEIIRNGVITDSYRCKLPLGLSELFQTLRQHGIKQLGQLQYVYIEPSGTVSIFRRTSDIPAGLPIVPPWEVVPPDVIPADTLIEGDAELACMQCGHVERLSGPVTPGDCPDCGHGEWTPARL